MTRLPSLPPGPIGVLSAAATVALLALAVAVWDRWRHGRKIEGIWALAPLGFLFLAFLAGRLRPGLHAPLAVGSMFLMVHNAIRLGGLARGATCVALVACTVAVWVALSLF